MKLFSAQRISKTAKPLQFLELMKAMFDCGGNTRHRSAGVRRHFFKRHKTGLFVSYDLLHEEEIKKARPLNIPQSCGRGRYAKRGVA
jgi:hypothetical protein